jgi:hypothetical protein
MAGGTPRRQEQAQRLGAARHAAQDSGSAGPAAADPGVGLPAAVRPGTDRQGRAQAVGVVLDDAGGRVQRVPDRADHAPQAQVQPAQGLRRRRRPRRGGGPKVGMTQALAKTAGSRERGVPRAGACAAGAETSHSRAELTRRPLALTISLSLTRDRFVCSVRAGISLVAVAQLAEHKVVVLGVAGSSPVSHPSTEALGVS